VDDFLSRLNTPLHFSAPDFSDEVDDDPEAAGPLPLTGSFGFRGKLRTPVSSSSATQFRRSPITGVLQPSKVCPAYLSPQERDGVMINPVFKSLSKAGSVGVLLNEQHVENSVSFISSQIFNCSSRRDSPISPETAIHGDPDDPLFPSMTLSTSPGYPATLRKKPGCPGKTTWIRHATPTTDAFVQEDLIAEVKTILRNASQGIRSKVFWLDFAKDETRPIEKVQVEMKTRTVNCSPMAFTIACRVAFGRFLLAKMAGRISNGTAAGINPYGMEWTHLAMHLLSVGDNMIAGDFGGWDGGMSSELLWAAYDAIEEWYTMCELSLDDDERPLPHDEYWEYVTPLTRKTLFHDIAFSNHVYGDIMYEWLKSMPSGTYLTECVNSLVNLLIQTLAWQSQGPAFDLQKFSKHVRSTCLGDDHVISVSTAYRDLFNQSHFKSFAESLGMTYTDEFKSARNDLTTRPLSEVQFLKRSFTFCPSTQRYLGRLEFDSIAENLNWLRNKLPVRVALKLNVECTFRELSLYDKCMYDDCLKKVRHAFARVNIAPPIVPSWEQNRYQCVELGRWMFDEI
jgi:hypothetical protein